jgi:hypothetical protein
MTFNTDYNNNVNFEGLDIYYPIGLNAIMSVLIFKAGIDNLNLSILNKLSLVLCGLFSLVPTVTTEDKE